MRTQHGEQLLQSQGEKPQAKPESLAFPASELSEDQCLSCELHSVLDSALAEEHRHCGPFSPPARETDAAAFILSVCDRSKYDFFHELAFLFCILCLFLCLVLLLNQPTPLLCGPS